MILQGASDWDSSAGLARGRLRKALLFSASLHFVLLWTTNPRPQLTIAQPLTVTLRERPAVARLPQAPIEAAALQMPVQAQGNSPIRRRRAPDQSPRRPILATSPTPHALSIQSRPPAPAELQPAVETAAAKSEGSVPATKGLSVSRAAPGAEGGPQAEDGVDPAALVDYRFAVVRAVKTRYPPLARERGWTGTAQVRLTVGPDGLPRSVTVVGSSGHAVLDAQARTIIAMAARIAALPPALLGKGFNVELPVEYRLDEVVSER